MNRKGLTIGLILLFIGTYLIPGTAQHTVISSDAICNGKWLYVGGDGPGNYTSIQDAIDNASNGDTVYVYHGTYRYLPWMTEHIDITKGINFIGENKLNTTIVGMDTIPTLLVAANDVRISGFTIRNSGDPGPDGDYGVALYISYDIQRIHIYDNIITDNYYGIFIDWEVVDIFIYNNTFSDNYIGIQSIQDFPFPSPLFISSSVQINNNTISNSTAAGLSVALRNASIYHNSISNNTIGVVLDGGDAACQLSNNQIQDNDIGVQVINARYTIQQNNFIHNRRQAITQKSVRLIEIPLLPFYRPNWINNYWDDWKTLLPRPISGLGTICFRYYIPNAYIDIPIAFFMCVQCDWHPAQEPYNIHNTC